MNCAKATAGTATQLAMMLDDLGVRMIFANTPQAKGRVERYSKRYRCVLCGVREHKKAELVSNQKELQDLLKKMRK